MRKMILQVRKRRRARQFREQHQSQSRGAHTHRYSAQVSNRRQTRSTPHDSVLRAWLKKDGWALGGIIIIVLGASWYVGFHSERFLVKDITINGTEFLSADEVKAAADEFILSRALGIVPRNTFWTVKPSKLQQHLNNRFAGQYALDSFEVHKTFPGSIAITVHELLPSIAWVTSSSGNNHYYLVSREGKVTQELQSKEEIHPSFPIVHDRNRDLFEVGWHIASQNYIAFILYLNEQFSEKTGLEVDSYVFPRTECQERQYVAEKVFQQGVLEGASDEFQEKKRGIQQRFLDGELTIDQSLLELERIKQEELVKLGEITEGEGSSAIEKLEFETVYVPTACDYVKVATNVTVVVKNGDHGTYEVSMDMSVDPIIQMENLLVVLKEKIQDRAGLRYIDVRIPDRAYYK